jgi:hypothetical protein
MKSLIVTLLLTSSITAFAQSVDYSKIVTPDSVEPANFEERLVRLAWQNYPLNRTYDAEVSTSKEEKIPISTVSFFPTICCRSTST